MYDSKIFSQEEIDRVYNLYLQKKTNDEITAITGFSEYYIIKILKQKGIKRKQGNPLPIVTERECKNCHQTKPIESFPKRLSCPSGRDYICLTCSNEKRNDRRLRRTYGINQNQYDEMFKNQEGKCKICGEPEVTIDPRNHNIRRLSVDHSHDEKRKVRGLLCQKCNVSLGNVNDNITLLEKMISYLKENE